MKYSEQNKPLVCMMTQSTCYKGTTVGRPVGILWHDTAARNTELRRYVQPSDNDPRKAELLALLGKNQYGNDANHVNTDAGLNAWIGKLADGTVSAVQVMPWNYRPWGCGSGKNGSCNGSPKVSNSPFWIQFETCDDAYDNVSRTYKSGTKAYFEKVYREACELTAYLCKLYNIDPNGTVKYNGITVPTILCHWDSYNLGLGSGHIDIYGWFEKYGKNMTTVRRDVTALLNASQSGQDPEPDEPPKTSEETVSVGDLVSIVSGATYYSGKKIPAWVMAKRWYVKSVKGDRAVIDKSEDGSASIMSAVNTKYLHVVKAASDNKPPEAPPVDQTPEKEEDEDMTLDAFKKLMAQYRAELQDNDAGKWSETARNWAIENGMIAGGGNDANGNPNYMYGDFLTREQAVMLFYRFAKMCGMV